MLPHELNSQMLLGILSLAIAGTGIFILLILFTVAFHVWTGGRWFFKLESIIFSQINKLDRHFYKILSVLWGKENNGKKKLNG